jgi:hypothetical protein
VLIIIIIDQEEWDDHMMLDLGSNSTYKLHSDFLLLSHSELYRLAVLTSLFAYPRGDLFGHNDVINSVATSIYYISYPRQSTTIFLQHHGQYRTSNLVAGGIDFILNRVSFAYICKG